MAGVLGYIKLAGAFRKLHMLSNAQTHEYTEKDTSVNSLFSLLSAISLSLRLGGRDFSLTTDAEYIGAFFGLKGTE